MASGNFDVVDVREPTEWSLGHLPGARLVPLQRLRANPRDALAREQASTPAPTSADEPGSSPGSKIDGIIFVCAAGVRSQTAAKVAEATGLRNLYNLAGGTRSWVNAGLPLVHD